MSRPLLDLAVRGGEAPDESRVAVLGPLEDLDQLLLDEVDEAHAVIVWTGLLCVSLDVAALQLAADVQRATTSYVNLDSIVRARLAMVRELPARRRG